MCWKYILPVVFMTIVVVAQGIREENGVTISRRFNCTLSSLDDRTCEACLNKGSDCFWCGGNVKRCLPYEWYFPGCDLDDVKHKKCWVNWTALIVVMSVICGILVVILISVVCYCCCKCSECRRQRMKKQGANRQAKEQVKRDELSMKQMERSARRQEELSYYREKYGYAAKDASPLPPKA